LVAALIACSAVVIVLADEVACVAAVFSFAAAAVTLVAAVETARDVGVALVAVPLVVVGRAALLAAVPVVADARPAVAPAAGFAAARVAVFLTVLAAGLAEFVRLALAVRGRVGFLAAAVVGTDLPPSGSVTGSLIPRCVKFYTWNPLDTPATPGTSAPVLLASGELRRLQVLSRADPYRTKQPARIPDDIRLVRPQQQRNPSGDNTARDQVQGKVPIDDEEERPPRWR
jgi:hypothetical protein